MARHAVCVGINEFKTLPVSSWLNGCVNDANDISKTLKKYGFSSRNITVLRDKEATKKKVMAALEAMVDKGQTPKTVAIALANYLQEVVNQVRAVIEQL